MTSISVNKNNPDNEVSPANFTRELEAIKKVSLKDPDSGVECQIILKKMKQLSEQYVAGIIDVIKSQRDSNDEKVLSEKLFRIHYEIIDLTKAARIINPNEPAFRNQYDEDHLTDLEHQKLCSSEGKNFNAVGMYLCRMFTDFISTSASKYFLDNYKKFEYRLMRSESRKQGLAKKHINLNEEGLPPRDRSLG